MDEYRVNPQGMIVEELSELEHVVIEQEKLVDICVFGMKPYECAMINLINIEHCLCGKFKDCGYYEQRMKDLIK